MEEKTPETSTHMQAVCQKLFQQYLQKDPARENVYFQTGDTMVLVETRQWKLAYSSLEKAKFDLTSESAIVIEVPGERGAHLIPWHMVLRITVNRGTGH
jgi:hypothetical protein